MVKRIWLFLPLLVALNGCGGGGGTSNKLLQYRAGAKWVYAFTGQVTLSGSQGSALPVQSGSSTVTMEVLPTTATDANNTSVNILDRKFDLLLLDGRHVQGVSRLYFGQLAEGLFVHGFNNSMGTTVNTANDKFVPSSANPAYSFLYLPDPVSSGTSLSYTNPFGAVQTGAYALLIGSTRQAVTVPAGDYLALPCAITETFDTFSITNGGFVPEAGLVIGSLQATLADGTTVSGTISLKSVSL